MLVYNHGYCTVDAAVVVHFIHDDVKQEVVKPLSWQQLVKKAYLHAT